MRTHRNDSSFTLIELILIVTIIAIVLGVASPHIKKSTEKALLSTLTKKISLFLDYAQKQAILKNNPLEIQVNSMERRIAFTNKENEKKEIPDITIPEAISFNCDKEVIAFFPNGTNSKFSLTLANNAGLIMTISSLGTDGKIKHTETHE